MTGRGGARPLPRRAVLGGALATALALATRAGAEPAIDAIRARGRLHVGIRTDLPPFGSRDARGRLVGFEIDLARYFARVLFDDERELELLPVTTATRFDALLGGQVDLLIATVTATEERRQRMALSDAYFMSASLVLVLETSAVQELAKLAGRRVAVVRGSIQEREVEERQRHAHVVAVASVADGVQAVKDGHADAFVYDDVPLLMRVRHDPALRVRGLPISPRPYAIAARPADTGLIRWVNGWLARMRRDGGYATMWRRHFEPFESRLVGG